MQSPRSTKYNDLLNKSICDIYKNILKDIYREAKLITSKLELEDRVETMAMKSAYITLKYHKENFPESSNAI